MKYNGVGKNCANCTISMRRGWGYASLFTRHVFNMMLKKEDISIIQKIAELYDRDLILKGNLTYDDFLCYAYKELIKIYRNEYVYKNTLLNAILKKYKKDDTVAFSEFAVGNSIADMVLFNGTSKVFEIKTELDSPYRLSSQLADYQKIFSECYLVIPESQKKKYSSLYPKVGLILLERKRGRISLCKEQFAEINTEIDPSALIRSLRTKEYKNLVESYFGALPTMNAFNSFEICESMMKLIPSEELHKLFVKIMKERKSNFSSLYNYSKPIRQMCLSLHISENEYVKLQSCLSKELYC